MLEFVYTLLGGFFTALPFIIALLFALGLVFLVAGLFMTPLVGAAAILLLFLVETVNVYLFAFKVGISVYPQDLLFMPMAGVALIRLMRPGAVSRLPKSLWVLTAVMTVAFMWGLVKNGTIAGVEFRSDFYLMTGLFYFSSFDWPRERVAKMLGWLFPVMLMIMLVVWYRWLADTIGLDWVEPLWRYTDITGVALRVINSQQTWMLGLAVILLVYAMAAGNSLARWYFTLPLLALTVVVLQHRSVWVAAFLPALLAFFIVRQSQGKLASRMLVIVAVTAAIAVPFLATGKFSGATSSVADLAVKATSTTEGTFVGRVQGWDSLLKQWAGSGPRTWVIGDPYGSGFKRPEGYGGKEIAYAPHNYYVQLLLRLGLVGLLAFLAFNVYLFRGAIRLAGGPHDNLTGYAMLGVLMSFALFNIPYSPTYTQGLFLGVILGLILQYQQKPIANEKPASVSSAQAAGNTVP
ncbi:MAG: O-antigen ligase family protein [Thiobacillus sp.]|uniref:O-antigen ligase family protein n=1 Tax=Thiobacillus sp. TaxID=924 RepID=UPI002734D61B|nr:O-antigen ligase family protein [Thiobacillus sp.]MDP3584442.1 O-antigen ligase family protein [Thiobacillus sp.]